MSKKGILAVHWHTLRVEWGSAAWMLSVHFQTPEQQLHFVEQMAVLPFCPEMDAEERECVCIYIHIYICVWCWFLSLLAFTWKYHYSLI